MLIERVEIKFEVWFNVLYLLFSLSVANIELLGLKGYLVD